MALQPLRFGRDTMTMIIWTTAAVAVFVAIRRSRYSKVRAMASRPYRYTSDVRRSKWAYRKGF